jgi:hypothetical protein
VKWFWKVPSPKLVYLMGCFLLYVCLFGAIAYLFHAITYGSLEALIVTHIFAVGGMIIAIITLGYWSIINGINKSIEDWQRGYEKGMDHGFDRGEYATLVLIHKEDSEIGERIHQKVRERRQSKNEEDSP